ncbi:glycosyltransferase family 1 protein [Sedimenticola selenatireducens]|uniref:Glycosyltransferase family 1 protein n=1 Tax=Sedimenticola selenatireducens TaxID=191960 RepID=A0A558DUU6_9GAMM|nr:glycosyltransferase family 1 protein [Sedimenticola selenatireducens]TVO72433.1 hypothetical protein FHP88_12615 [Sedimenticola selenatireducens]TVT64688.1 MAG: hypothetical protein FHK78_06380 [Sedimenticola selenatireducens]
MTEKKHILLLCHYYPGAAGAIIDHIESFSKHSKNKYLILSNMGELPDWLELDRFDALIFHYSLIACYDNYISPSGRKRIREFTGFKAAFVQDDYRWINDTVDALSYMKINALFPLAGSDIINDIYSPTKLPNVRKETVLAGYVPLELVSLSVKPYSERMIDIGYRARKLPAWMGAHTLQKWQIAEGILKEVKKYKLMVDISCKEEDRIYGDSWIKFLTDCKATLGTESGASVCDFTGDIQRNVEAHLKRHPKEDFYKLRDLYFKEDDGVYMMNVISPRCFEAAALRTLMILYEGEYSGVLVPWRHYVPLKQDHSNIKEIVEVIKSPEEAQKIIDHAYYEVAKNKEYSYEAMVKLVDRVIDEEWSVAMEKRERNYSADEFQWYQSTSPRLLNNSAKNEIERSIFYPIKKTSSRKLSGEGIGSDSILDVYLVRKFCISRIIVAWGDDQKLIPSEYEIQGWRGNMIIGEQIISNYQKSTFQTIQWCENKVGVDLLKIKVKAPLAREVAQVLSISVIAREKKKLHTIMWIHVKVNLTRKLHNIWRGMPESVRAVLLPAIKVLKKLA